MAARARYIDCSQEILKIMATLDPALTADIDCHLGDPAPEDLAGQAKGYPMLLNGHTKMDAALLEHLSPELERVVFLGTGAGTYIDMTAAAGNGIEIVTIASYGDRSVAEHAFALLLAAARGVARMDREMRQGRWVRCAGMELKDKRIGIVGFGGIGRELAALCLGFGMQVMVWNRSAVELPDGCARAPDLKSVFCDCDAVSLHLAYSEETRRIIGHDLLASMRPGSMLINTARAELVDADALIDALREGPLGHAAIDVFEPEPPDAHDPLLGLANVTLTAHTAWMTPDASRRLLERGLQALAS